PLTDDRTNLLRAIELRDRERTEVVGDLVEPPRPIPFRGVRELLIVRACPVERHERAEAAGLGDAPVAHRLAGGWQEHFFRSRSRPASWSACASLPIACSPLFPVAIRYCRKRAVGAGTSHSPVAHRLAARAYGKARFRTPS